MEAHRGDETFCCRKALEFRFCFQIAKARDLQLTKHASLAMPASSDGGVLRRRLKAVAYKFEYKSLSRFGGLEFP